MSEPALSRRRLISLGGLVAVATLAACQRDSTSRAGSPVATTTEPVTALTPADGLARLEAGNARFATGGTMHPNQSVEARETVADHQHPWALIHGCIDSRVPPELVFDQGVGDVFSSRTGGAVLDDTIVGSMEFAVNSPYDTPLIVILGHTGCGAVTAAVDALNAGPSAAGAPGEVADIVKEIIPVAQQVPPDPDRARFIDNVVRANTISVADALVKRSKIIRDAVDANHVRVVPALYDLASGRVNWLTATG